MKQFLLSCALILTIACGSHTPPQPVPVAPLTVTQEVQKSVVRITLQTPMDGMYVCTGWSIGPRKFMTAAHCTVPLHEFVGSVLRVNDRVAFVTAEDEVTDLSTVVADLTKPALTIRLSVLEIGEHVQATGYGYGFTSPLVTNHVVQLLNYTIQEDIYPGIVFLYPFIGGMSGGPIYDKDGNVVGIVQRGTTAIGYGVNSDTITEFLRKTSS